MGGDGHYYPFQGLCPTHLHALLIYELLWSSIPLSRGDISLSGNAGLSTSDLSHIDAVFSDRVLESTRQVSRPSVLASGVWFQSFSL